MSSGKRCLLDGMAGAVCSCLDSWAQGTYEYNPTGTSYRIFFTAHSHPGEPDHFRIATLTSHLWWAKTWIPAVCTAPTCHLPPSQRHLSHLKHSGRRLRRIAFSTSPPLSTVQPGTRRLHGSLTGPAGLCVCITPKQLRQKLRLSSAAL